MRNILIAIVLVASCGGYRAKVMHEEAQHREDMLRTRAAFDLSCDASKLVLTDLAANAINEGVEGCGQKASYVWTDQGWVMNVINGQAGPPPATTTQGTAP